MAKARDLLGKTGSAGFNSGPTKPVISTTPELDVKDPKHPDFKPPQDAKPAKGGKHAAGGGGGTGTVRPKV